MSGILGLSAYYHDSAAALVVDGRIVAAAQEERFTRRKYDACFPAHAARYCLEAGGLELSELDAVVFYDKPFLKFERLLETYMSCAPHGMRSFAAAMPVWLKEKLFLKAELRRSLAGLHGGVREGTQPSSGFAASESLGWRRKVAVTPREPPLLFSEHHLSHAASAFYPGPFETAAVLCLDGVGEWATTSAWVGRGAKLTPLWEQHFPHSLGLLYSAFTYYTGFRVNSGEYKMMGLAPYGAPRYADLIRERLIDVKPDGTFRLDMRYFDYATGLTMTSAHFDELFGGPARDPDGAIDQRTMDLAASIQLVTEEVMLELARTLREETGEHHLCLAGGVALNCVANGRVLREAGYDDLWIQPAAGDAGGAVGAALEAWHRRGVRMRLPPGHTDAMQGALLGPAIGDDDEVAGLLSRQSIPHERLSGTAELVERVAGLIAEGFVVGWVQGRMEFGPRALGNRSILADPRNPSMQRDLNLKTKFRESFRPFAPSVIEESVAQHFELDRPSPYMLIVAPVRGATDRPAEPVPPLAGLDRLKAVRSPLPAVTHVDSSARVQTVSRHTNPRFHALLEAFGRRTGIPVLVNTSFNVRGEPIACTVADAYRCFMSTAMDYLVIGTSLMRRADQPAGHPWAAGDRSFEPD